MPWGLLLNGALNYIYHTLLVMKKITSFWNWFQKNELAFLNAVFLGLDADVVFPLFDKKLRAVSTIIGFEIAKSQDPGKKSRLVFTACGRRRFFAKITALVREAPPLEYFSVTALVPPYAGIEKIREGTDPPIYYRDYHIRVSQLKMALLDYSVARKELKIIVYIPDYDYLKDYDDLEENIYWIVMEVIGELAYGKHIKSVQMEQLPPDPEGLCALVELAEIIAFLYVVNSRGKTRVV